jgi:hydroxymethylbilane synthase
MLAFEFKNCCAIFKFERKDFMESTTKRTITLGSRSSKLALWQTGHILDRLESAHPDLSFRVVTLITEGDQRLDRALAEIGGKGVFTAELEKALHTGEIDLAVHSLKDLPVADSPGLMIGAISQRANPQDVLISASGLTLQNLPEGAHVGTSSLRREAQLRALRPDLVIQPLRGNIDTRLRKAQQGEYDAIVLAAAGMERLDLRQYVTQYLPLDVMLPSPGQGALAVQCRADDLGLLALLHSIHHEATARAVNAERAFLAALQVGCSSPVAAYAETNDKKIDLRGLIATVDGSHLIRLRASGESPKDLGKLLAQQALEQGAGEML